MASPLHIFRRYQKALIAGGIVMLMIAFAITSVPNTLMDRQQRGDPVVFTTRKGEVRERELYGMIEARRLAHRFLYESITLAVRNLMQQRELQSIPPQQIFEILLSGLANDGIELRREIDEESFVRTLIIARKAEEVGISVSDEAINEFLRDRTLKKVTPEQFRQIISDMKISQRTLFDAIRLELLSVRLRQMVFSISAVRGIPPG
ncbi:MAG: hypothetical protein JNG90_17795, partial [Planctomycetaceae bacterium]|nr:hypothetical protein [Planctomycetaceae bacterium]